MKACPSKPKATVKKEFNNFKTTKKTIEKGH